MEKQSWTVSDVILFIIGWGMTILGAIFIAFVMVGCGDNIPVVEIIEPDAMVWNSDCCDYMPDIAKVRRCGSATIPPMTCAVFACKYNDMTIPVHTCHMATRQGTHISCEYSLTRECECRATYAEDVIARWPVGTPEPLSCRE